MAEKIARDSSHPFDPLEPVTGAQQYAEYEGFAADVPKTDAMMAYARGGATDPGTTAANGARARRMFSAGVPREARRHPAGHADRRRGRLPDARPVAPTAVFSRRGLHPANGLNVFNTDGSLACTVATWSFQRRGHQGRSVARGADIRVREGQIVHTELNSATGPHVIHHHGIEPSPINDGVGHLTMDIGGRAVRVPVARRRVGHVLLPLPREHRAPLRARHVRPAHHRSERRGRAVRRSAGRAPCTSGTTSSRTAARRCGSWTTSTRAGTAAERARARAADHRHVASGVQATRDPLAAATRHLRVHADTTIRTTRASTTSGRTSSSAPASPPVESGDQHDAGRGPHRGHAGQRNHPRRPPRRAGSSSARSTRATPDELGVPDRHPGSGHRRRRPDLRPRAVRPATRARSRSRASATSSGSASRAAGTCSSTSRATRRSGATR